MANGNRDVSLVIRAKNEASRTLDTIASSLDALRKSQSNVASGSAATSNTLSRLGTELNKLKQSLANVSSDTLAKNLLDASAAVGRLDAALNDAAQSQTRMQSELQRTAVTTDRLSRRSQQLTDRLNNQRLATQQADSQVKASAAALKNAEKVLSTATAKTQVFTDRLTRQDAALDKTKARYRDLAQQILAANQPSDKLLASFAKVEDRLDRQTQALQRTRSGYAALQASIQSTQASIPGLTNAQQQSVSAFEQAVSAQAKTARALDHVSRAKREVEARTRKLEQAIASNSDSIQRQSAALQTARDELNRLQSAANSANAALGKIGTTVRQQLLTSLKGAQTDVARLRTEWQATQAAIAKGFQSGQSAQSPEMQRLINLARAQKRAFEETRNATAQYRAAIRAAGTDVDRLAAAERSFSEATTRAAAALKAATVASQQNTAANDRNTASTQRNAAAMAALEGRGRAAMTWAQRLRGEIVALTLAYVGLYASIQELSGVTNAFLEMEAAATRMNVAFQGNEALSAREMRWVRDEADRLGIQLGVLAGEYSKFAIASRGTSLEGAEARRIFQAVTEAARVNKLSIDQVRGTFLALTQMLSKGAVSMEELRQQLGERLYGAFNLAAEAMGMTTAEFSKLVATGGVASEPFLIKFADQLEEAYGEHLPDALDTFTTDLGRFQNEVFKTQLKVAEAGFIAGLRDALIELTAFFQSEEGTQFFETLGAAAGGLVRVLATIPRYFQEILLVLTAMAGVRIVAWLGAMRAGFVAALAAARPLPATLNASAAAGAAAAGGVAATRAAALAAMTPMQRFQRSIHRMNILLGTARGRALALRSSLVSLRAALAMVGGVPGLIVTGISLALVTWLTRTKDVAAATEQHERQMNRLIDQYSRVKEAAGDWAKAVEDGLDGLTLDQVRQSFRQQLDKMRDDAQAAFAEIGGRLSAESLTVGGLVTNGRDPALMELQRLSRAMRDGTIRASEYQKALNDILASDNVSERVRDLIENSATLTQGLVDQEERLLESATAVRELGGSLDELPAILAGVVPTLEELAGDLADVAGADTADPLARLNTEVEKLRGKIPSLSNELKMMEELTAIDQILDTASAIEGIDKTSEAFQRFLGLVQQAKDEIRDAFDSRRFQAAAQAIGTPGASSAELSASLIRQREGYRETPYYDVNAFRAGFGSDTVTLEDGSVKAVTEGMRVSVADANRDLVRRIGEFQSTVRRQVGEGAWTGMNPQQQAVLTSNAYNYGSLEDALVEAVRSGNQAAVQSALRAQGDDNSGVNRERRQQEAFLFGQADTINAEANLRYVEDQLKEHEQLIERAAEYNSQLDRTLTRRAEDLQYVDGLTKEMAVARALEDERLNAQRIGVSLSQEQLALIEQNAATAWDQEAAEQSVKEAKERQAEIDRELNLLVQQRRDLLEQIEFFQDRGDVDAAQRLREQFDAVTGSVREAIDAQIEFWKAARGGEDSAEADAAIVRLQNLRNSLLETNQTAILTSRSMGLAFGEQLKAGADGFIQKIRETGDIFGSLRLSFQQFAMEFLTQVAQMALRQLMLNGIMAAFNAMTGGAASAGGGGGFIQGVLAGVSHDGGVAGSSNRSRTVSPGLFANAARYHTGGIAGLKANEVPAVLERGEEVLTEADPRHRDNVGAGNSDAPPRGLSVVLVQDQTDIVSAMQSSAGDQVILQYLKNNRRTVKQLMS